jgi:hypothetical protein
VLRVSGAGDDLAAVEVGRPFAVSRGEGALQLVYGRPTEAAAVALRLLDRFGEAVRIGGDYGLAQTSEHGEPHIGGGAPTMAGRLAASAAPGYAQVSAAFAAALHLDHDPPARTEYMGDLSGSGPENPVRAYALAPARS